MNNHEEGGSTDKGKGVEGDRVNPAKAAFEEYRRRMASHATSAAPGSPGPRTRRPGEYPWHPHDQGMGMPGHSHGDSPPRVHPGVVPRETASEGSLFAGVGKMLRLGVDVITAGLAGGLQLIEGFSGYGEYRGESWTWDDPCCCHDECCRGHFPSHHGFGGHGCTPSWHWGHYHHCNPSVHNC